MKVGTGLCQGSRWAWIALASTISYCSFTSPVAARGRGIVGDSCFGCHGGGGAPEAELSLTAEPASFGPGELVTFTLAVREPSIRVGGVYLSTGGVGTLQPLAGEGLASSGAGLAHTAPKAATNGAATFRFAWRAPSAPGAVDFGVAALAGNGNNASSGDSPGGRSFQWVFGCAGRTFFLDLDRDGYGAKALGTKLGCDDAPAPVGFAVMDGDCDENDEKANPSGAEVCNKKDDDCDGQVDEGAEPVPLWPDADGDGFYGAPTGSARMGCGNVPGYAANPGDCDDLEPAVNPGVAETCNGKDDDCDQVVDEQVRPQCGAGWCARYSPTCDLADCTPGPPLAETCNSFDDDCDGEVDNDACAAGLVCSANQCVAAEVPGGVPPGPGAGGSTPSVAEPGTAGGPPRESAPQRADSGCSLRLGAGASLEPWLLAALLGIARSLRRRSAA
jgi:Putative metal-binding motif